MQYTNSKRHLADNQNFTAVLGIMYFSTFLHFRPDGISVNINKMAQLEKEKEG